jgi:hypothetical protein
MLKVGTMLVPALASSQVWCGVSEILIFFTGRRLHSDLGAEEASQEAPAIPALC